MMSATHRQFLLCTSLLLTFGWYSLSIATTTTTKDNLTLVLMTTVTKFNERLLRSPMVLTARELNSNSLMSWHNNYTLQTKFLRMDHFSPRELLEKLCNETLNARASVVLYVEGEDSKSSSSSSIQYLLRVVDFIGLPVIVSVRQSASLVQPTVDSSVLQLTPSIYHQCQATLSLLKRYNWRQFAVITGSMPGHNHFVNVLRDLIDSFSKEGWYEILVAVNIQTHNNDDVSNQLTRVHKSDARVILMYATNKEMEKILTDAKERQMTGKEFVWIVFLATDSPNPTHHIFHDGMFGIDFRYDIDGQGLAVKAATTLWARALDAMYRDSIDNGLHNISLKPPVNVDCTSRHQTKWHDGQTLLRYMKNDAADVDKTRFTFNNDGTLKDTQVLIRNRRLDQWKEIGQWTPQDGLKMDDITWPGGEHMPPRGRPEKSHLRIVTIQELPYVIYSDLDPETRTCPPQSLPCRVNKRGHFNVSDNSTSASHCCSGLCMDLLKMLSEKIGLEFELFEVPDKKWGAYDKEKKEWNGIIRSLLNGDADMAVTSLKITPERSQEIDFSVPFLETGITILVPVREGVISPTAFLEPYDFASWCLILVFSVHASGAALFLVEWLSPNGLDRGMKPIREHKFSLFRAFWLIWAMLFGAAVKVDTPRGVASRFLASVWALFAVVFTASYTANLAAFMIAKDDYDKLTGIKDPRLVNAENYKPPFRYATVPDGSTETNIKNNHQPMYRYMEKHKYPIYDAIDGVRAVKNGVINAFIYDATVLEYMASHDDGCKLKTVGKWCAMTGYGIGFPKGSRWIDIVNKYMVQFQYDGEMERLQKFWLAGVCKKSDNSKGGESSKPLEILNFTSAFILLTCGMVIVAVLLAVEHGYFKIFRAKLRKWDQRGCCSLVSLSVGKSLTFEHTVREAMELQKNYKCKNPICETQLWKLRHELDLAQLNIQRLQRLTRRFKVTSSDNHDSTSSSNELRPSASSSCLSRGRTSTLPISWNNDVKYRQKTFTDNGNQLLPRHVASKHHSQGDVSVSVYEREVITKPNHVPNPPSYQHAIFAGGDLSSSTAVESVVVNVDHVTDDRKGGKGSKINHQHRADHAAFKYSSPDESRPSKCGEFSTKSDRNQRLNVTRSQHSISHVDVTGGGLCVVSTTAAAAAAENCPNLLSRRQSSDSNESSSMVALHVGTNVTVPRITGGADSTGLSNAKIVTQRLTQSEIETAL